MLIALVGPDGAGKSLVAHRAVAALGERAQYMYMGVSLESSNVMLPTTRLARHLRHRGGPPAAAQPAPGATVSAANPLRAPRRPNGTARSLLRLAGWAAEEWYRQLLIWLAQARGRVVVVDRHFFLDFYAHDIRGTDRPLARRLHGMMLEHLYPRPDLVIFLDVPAPVLFARKGEGTVESLERRRQEYLAAAAHVRRFVTVDGTCPPDEVVDNVLASIRQAMMDAYTARTSS
jgi:thymidylate kinase